MIEQAHLDPDKINLWLTEHLRDLSQSKADTLVLGCTHYPFIKDLIQAHLGAQMRLIDTGQAVVNHLSNFLHKDPLHLGKASQRGSVLWLCNVDPALFALKAQKLLIDFPMTGANSKYLEI
jgi:glutamate racemase